MRRMALAIMAVCAAVAMTVPAHAITGEKAEFKKVADGVYAFIGKLNDANALVVVTSQGVVVVDTGNNPPETRILQKFIRSVTDQPVRYVVITQNHGDHTGGTPLFAPPATVVVHDRVAKEIASRILPGSRRHSIASCREWARRSRRWSRSGSAERSRRWGRRDGG